MYSIYKIDGHKNGRLRTDFYIGKIRIKFGGPSFLHYIPTLKKDDLQTFLLFSYMEGIKSRPFSYKVPRSVTKCPVQREAVAENPIIFAGAKITTNSARNC